MYIDDDFIKFYDPSYDYSNQTQDLPSWCPYRQMNPLPPMPFQHGQHGSPASGPTSPPPNFTPPKPKTQQFGATPLAIDQGAIRPCRFRMVYIWPRRGQGFWAWLTFVGPKSIAGFRWNRNRWIYFGMDLRGISSFQCF